ncbi:hypothetical protein Trco_007441 [Trichoderma cornu-damae]|uniref:Uncharacterized protein n=1 Tax=Trichoderma cornu-damae TaxID=654480 RepID=A0A9P8QED2_9HYPO|nr:hypothetical protein Trco_007441 [Trichoderma cornu-damae]
MPPLQVRSSEQSLSVPQEAPAQRGGRRRGAARGDAGLDGLVEVAVLDSQLSLPEHDAANVGEVESGDAVVGREQRAGGNVTLVAVGTAGQRTNEQSSVADALAPVLDSSVEAGLADVAVAVVVELDPDVVGELADVEGLRGVGEGALRSGSQVIPLAGVLGEVGLEALGHGKINTIKLDASKGTERRAGGTAQEQVPDRIGKLLPLSITGERSRRVADSTAHAENDELAGGLASLDGGDQGSTVLEVDGAGGLLRSGGATQGAQRELRVSTAGEEPAQEGQVDNVVGRVGAHVGESGAVILGTPVDDELASSGTLLDGWCGMSSNGQEAGSNQCFGTGSKRSRGISLVKNPEGGTTKSGSTMQQPGRRWL